MQVTEKVYSKKLLLAFAAVALAFTSATLYANWRLLEIGDRSRDISLDALPSIERLTRVNDTLREIERRCDEYPQLEVDQRGAARERIEATWRVVDQNLDAYVAMPAFEGELRLYEDVPVTLRVMVDAQRRLLEQVDHGERAATHASEDELDAIVDRLAAELRQLIEFNALHLYQSIERIEVTRTQTARVAVILDAFGLLVAAIAVGWVTRLFRAHMRILRAHAALVEGRAAELEVFGKRVAHDLLSPLSALTFCLARFKRAAAGDPELTDAMNRARLCVRRAQTMVDSIFAFARSGGRPDPTARASLKDAIEQVVDDLDPEEPNRPEISMEPFPPRVVACSPGVLFSVLSNLVRNAVKYTSDSPVRHITVRARDEGDAVCVEVEDTGPGVALELQAQIFEPYVRAEGATQPGLGLGLATVKRLCEAYGGAVGVRSKPGRGAVFWFTLPRRDDAAATETVTRAVRLTRII